MRWWRLRQCNWVQDSVSVGGAGQGEAWSSVDGRSQPRKSKDHVGLAGHSVCVLTGRWFGWMRSSGRGSVTAEFAVVLPAVTALLALLLLGAGAGVLQLRLEEGARAGARALARGESTAQAAEIARRLSGGETAVSVDLSGGYATVTLTGRVSGPLAAMVPWQQSARASARLEDLEPDQGLAMGPRVGIALPLRKTALWRWARAPAVDGGSMDWALTADGSLELGPGGGRLWSGGKP